MKKYFYFALISSIAYANTDLLEQGKEAFRQKNALRAKELFSEIIAHDSRNIDALQWLGITYFYEGNFERAAQLLGQCVQLDSQNPEVIEQYATILDHLGQYERARHLFEILHDYDRKREKPWIKLPPLYLRTKDWYYVGKFIPIKDLWWYSYDLANKKVLLDLGSTWNGHGDVMHIIRYAKHLHKAGAHVTVKVRDDLMPLLKLCPYLNHVIGLERSNPIVDHTYELTTDKSLVCMRDQLYEPCPDVPYLYADKKLTNYWHAICAQDNNLKVGLCWQSTKLQDHFSGELLPGPKSVTLEQLAPLLQTNGVSFYSLQKAEDEAIRQWNNKHPEHTIKTFEDFDVEPFMDSAALINNLDLVITVDSAIAHLAGGLGAPTWLMLPYAADFRWFEQTETRSPLYPFMRLFRQQKYGNWYTVINEVYKTLNVLVSEKQNSKK